MKRTLKLKNVAEWLLVGIIFLLPLQTRWIVRPGMLENSPWEYGTMSLYALDILVGAFLFVAAAIMVRERRFLYTLPLMLAFLFGVIAFFSMVFSVNRDATLFGFWKLIEGIALFTAIIHLRIRFRNIVIALLSAATIQSVLAVMQFVMQEIPASTLFGIASQNPMVRGVQVIETDGVRWLRAYGTFPHPNMLGGFLSVALLVGVMWYCHMPPQWKRLLLVVSMSVTSMGLWLSFSRQAFLATIIVLAIIVSATFFHRTHFPQQLFMSMVFILLPLFAFSVLFPDMVATRLAITPRLEAQSLSTRQALQKESIAIVKATWLTGIGINTITGKMHERDEQRGQTREASAYQPVHNIYLLILTELGIFGMLTFLLFLASIIQHRAFPFTAGFLALIIIGFFDHYLWTLHSGILLFWIMAALATRHAETFDERTAL